MDWAGMTDLLYDESGENIVDMIGMYAEFFKELAKDLNFTFVISPAPGT